MIQFKIHDVNSWYIDISKYCIENVSYESKIQTLGYSIKQRDKLL